MTQKYEMSLNTAVMMEKQTETDRKQKAKHKSRKSNQQMNAGKLLGKLLTSIQSEGKQQQTAIGHCVLLHTFPCHTNANYPRNKAGIMRGGGDTSVS